MKHAKGGGFLVKVDRWAPVGLPLGRAMIWSGALGAAKGLGALAAKFIPINAFLPAKYEAPVAQTLFAVLVRLGFVKRFIGENLSSVLSVASMVAAVDHLVPIGQWLGDMISPPEKRAYFMYPLNLSAAGGPLENIIGVFRNLLGSKVGVVSEPAEGTSGIGDVDTLIPVQGYDQFSGMGATMLTSTERKLAAIAG